MPGGKFQTEYMRNFKWSDRPIRFKQPPAALDQQPRRAGLASSTIGIRREPQIQVKNHSASPVEMAPTQSVSEPKVHRSSSNSHNHHHHHHHSSKNGLFLSASGSALPFSDPLYRPVPPLITSARSDDAQPAGKPTWKRPGDPTSAVADDFILLGSQQKFAPNVAYRLRKPLDPSRLSQLPPQPQTAERFEQDTQTVELPQQQQPPPPPQPPVARIYTADENVQVELPKDNLTPPPSPPDAPRREKTPEPTAAANVPVQTEAVQTDVDEHYAVRQRLGLVSRVNGARFQTEYGRQFNPTHAVSAPAFRRMKQQEIESPVMNADQMFRRSRSRSPIGNATIQPTTLMLTEYNRSFKPYQWQLHQQPIRRSLSAEGHEIQYEAKVPSPSERKHHPKHKEEAIAKIKNLKWPKRFLSEYMSNFRQPSAFKYEDGTWKGVSQPHVVVAQSAPPTAVVEGDPSWLAEVRELKSRAKEYQLRNKGTHFSSTHVGQLFSEKARLWDMAEQQQVGDGGSRLAMLDVTVPPSAPPAPAVQQEVAAPQVVQEYVQVDTLPAPQDLIRPAGLPTVRRGNVRQSLEWAVQSTESSPVTSESECSSSVEEPVPQPAQPSHHTQSLVQEVVNRLDIPPKTTRSEESSASATSSGSTGGSSSTSGVLPSTAGGRVPTSRLAELQVSGNGSPRRHHLDVTTPAVGGAILVSPPIPAGETKKKHKSRHRSSFVDESVRTVPNTAGPSSGYSSVAVSVSGRPKSPPAFGKPTPDTHLIVDRDKPIRFQYVPNPKNKPQPPPATTESRPLTGTIEQLILERSRDNAPFINASIGKASFPSPTKKNSAPPTSKSTSSSHHDTKTTQRSAGVMAHIPEPHSATYKVSGAANQKAATAKLPSRIAMSERQSPPFRVPSAASDILEKARARANFWVKA